ncbi:MAG: very short patch repair endonuclease [Thermoplasmata archaeon]|nr:very short patch repair endonuclease [Thermoplasmata archaeon]
MQANRGKDTAPELALRKALRARGLTGYRLQPKGLPGRPDVTFVLSRVAIFVHGCYWHRCPHCRLPLPKTHSAFWRDKFEQNKERDRRDRQLLEKAGWRVLTLWECELDDDVGLAAERVAALLGNGG